MSGSQIVESVLDDFGILVDMAGMNAEIPEGERRFERDYLSAAQTSGDVDWTVYYLNRLTVRTAGTIGHIGIGTGPEFMELFKVLISDIDGLADVIRSGDSVAIESLQKQLEEWQSAHGVQPKPHRVDRSPLVAR